MQSFRIQTFLVLLLNRKIFLNFTWTSSLINVQYQFINEIISTFFSSVWLCVCVLFIKETNCLNIYFKEYTPFNDNKTTTDTIQLLTELKFYEIAVIKTLDFFSDNILVTFGGRGFFFTKPSTFP